MFWGCSAWPVGELGCTGMMSCYLMPGNEWENGILWVQSASVGIATVFLWVLHSSDLCNLGYEGHEVMYDTLVCVYISWMKINSFYLFHMSTVVTSNVKETVISTMSKQPTSPSSGSKCHIKRCWAGIHMGSIRDVQ